MERLATEAEPFCRLFNLSETTIALQPIFDIQNTENKTLVFEALLRLPQSSDPLCHVHVLALAEKLGFAHYIDLFVLGKVVDMLRRTKNTKISINLSQRSILDDGQQILRRLAATQMCDRLIVEITESSQIPYSWIATFAAGVREIGCDLAVDDFDTGFSDELLVRSVKPNVLKMTMDECTKPFLSRLRRTIDLADEIGAQVVMEKVDSIEKYEIAFSHGVGYAQGFMLAKPMLAKNIPEWISARLLQMEVSVNDRGTAFISDRSSLRCIESADGNGQVRFKQKTGS